MSTFLTDIIKEGDIVDVMKPKGRFILGTQEKVVGICAGSGITPIMSMMKTILEQEPNSSFTLFYGNKNTS